MSYKNKLDTMIWSFSRIHLWEQCPYSFYLRYIEGKKDDDNFWAANGRAVHYTLEKFFKQELSLSDMPSFYMERFDEICSFASQTTMDTVFNACIDFFCEFDFSFFNHYEILGVEKKCSFMVGQYKFRGVIDLLLKHKHTNELLVLDHKSSPYPFKMDGKSVLKNCRDNFQSYQNQMYLYCKPVMDEYGAYPSYLTWLHFKDQKIATIPFDASAYARTWHWAEDTVAKIYDDTLFQPKESFMMCNKLCGFRNGECDYKVYKSESS